MDFVNKEFLHKKINNKDVYMWFVLQKIFQKMHVIKVAWLSEPGIMEI